MISTKEKPFAPPSKQRAIERSNTPMQRQNNTKSINIKASKDHLSLIKINKNQILTTSLIVAEKFNKRHYNVLQKIENLIEEDINTDLNFKVSKYKDATGRFLKMYCMDKKSFIILFMRFTGKPALNKQIKFVDAFEKMERILLNRQNVSWQQARIEGKENRFKLTEAIKKLVELAKKHGSKNADKYYVAITNMIYKQVFALKNVPDKFRDNLGKNELDQLQFVEWKIAEWLNESIDKCLDYHEPYAEIKKRLTNLIAVIGVINLNSQIAA